MSQVVVSFQRREINCGTGLTVPQTVPSNNSPYADLPSINSALFEAKARKGEKPDNKILKIRPTFKISRVNL